MKNTETEEKEEELNDTRLPLGTHIEDLRKRVFYCIIAIIFGFILCWIFKVQILDIVKRPHGIAMQKLGQSTELQVLSYQEGFYAYMKLCFITSLFLMYPFIIYQLWKFVSEGLYEKEKKYVLLFFPVSFVAFILGGIFGYFLLIPFGLQFLISILGPEVQPIITMQQYVSFVFLLTVALGLVFQLPLVMLLLSKIRFITADKFKLWRKYSILAIFIIAAIVSPPDPFTQTMTAAPMILLYEIGILISKPTKKGFCILGTAVGGAIIVVVGLYFYFITNRGKIDIKTNPGYIQQLFPGSDTWKNIAQKPYLRPGIRLKTGNEKKSALSLKNGNSISLDTNTEIQFIDKWCVELEKGQIFVEVKNTKDYFEVITANGRIRLKNGRFNIQTADFVTIVTAVKGSAVLFSEGVEQQLREGCQLKMSIGGEPVDIGEIIDWSEGILDKIGEGKNK